MRALRDLRRRGADERAFTLVEMLVVLVILSTVLSALIAVFVSALRTEVDQNRRFEAQQDARIAVDKLRREIHCGANAFVQPGGTGVTIQAASTATTGYCRAGDTSWCTTASGAGFTLLRASGTTCDASSIPVAQHLTSANVFEFTHPLDSRALLRVDIRIDVDPNNSTGAYRLFDEIVLRGSPR
jgi:prepilin-type N-terminal cleavage/methylation domain-containing protein